MNGRTKGIFALMLTAGLYGLFGLFSRIISFQIPLFFQQFIRNVFAVGILGIVILYTETWKKIEQRDFVWFALRGVSGFISFITLYIGFIKLEFSTNYFISYATSTIAGYLIGSIFFSEKINSKKMIALLFSMLGLFLVYRMNFYINNSFYMILSALGGVATSAWGIFSKKISGVYSTIQLNFVDFLIVMIFSLVFSLLLHEQWTLPVFNTVWFAIFLYSLLFIGTGFLIVYGFSLVEAQIGSIILLFDIVVGITLGYIVFHEVISVPTIVGGIMIIMAIIIPTLPDGKIYRGNSFKHR